MTIEIESRTYVVAAGEVISSSGEPAFRISDDDLSHPPKLVNNGSIEVTAKGSAYGLVEGTGHYQAATFIGEAGSVMTVEAAGKDAFACGIDLRHFQQLTFENAGDFRILSSGDAVGVDSLGTSFANTGLFEVVAAGDATGWRSWNAARSQNDGRIEVTGHGVVYGADLKYGGDFHNTGSIRVSAGEGSAVAVRTGSSDHFTNSGKLIAHGTEACAILATSGTIDIANSGSLKAGVAIHAGEDKSMAAVHLQNSGLIKGELQLGSGGDDVLNTGKLIGDVLLGAGDDDFDGALGLNKGMLVGGAGDDDITGGAGAERIYGDEPSTHLGDGSDDLRGGGGGDTLTGGNGHDRFTYAAVSDSVRARPDLITDLQNIDTIDLSRIDADALQAGDQAFVLVADLDGHAGQVALSYDAGADLTRLELDVDGDGKADAVITMTGDHTDFAHFIF